MRRSAFNVVLDLISDPTFPKTRPTRFSRFGFGAQTTIPIVAAVLLSSSAFASAPPEIAQKIKTCDAVTEKPKAEKKEKTTLEKADDAFGAIFVGPLAKVLFFDIYFWDNGTPENPQSWIGQTAGTNEIVGFAEVEQDGSGAMPKCNWKVWDKKGGTPKEGKGPCAHAPAPGFQLKRIYTEVAKRLQVIQPRRPQIESAPHYQTYYGKVSVQPRHNVAVVDVAELDLTGAMLTPLPDYKGPAIGNLDDAAGSDRSNLQVWTSSAPFPVVVRVQKGANKGVTLPTEVPLAALKRLPQPPPPPPVQLGQGVKVRVGDAACHLADTAVVRKLLAKGPTGKVELLSQTITANPGNPRDTSLPFIVVWLVLGAIYFTLKMNFINVRAFRHALDVVRGHYDSPDHPGEISHFQALSSALSATVGLGNIAGVAIAVSTGGPGAVFWMIIAGGLGMTSKFTECTLGQMYRHVDDNGVVLGGPMQYLRFGFAKLTENGGPAFLKPVGAVASVIFAVMCIGGSFGGGNMFQSNQSFAVLASQIPSIAAYGWVYGIVMAILVGLVIIGGIQRIGAAASFLVPAMCGMYLLAGAWILLANFSHLGWALGVIVGEAFTPQAGLGGAVGVLITGFKRAAFSNEAGVGSAAIAHSAAATDEPVREGIVASLGPFIDTIIVCTMTGLVVVITGAYQVEGVDGVVMTSLAFGSVISWFPWVLTVAVVLFAFSTMISWSYYGERCTIRLFGPSASLPYRIVYCVFVFFGAVFKLGNVLDFSDLMILGMAFPNILGVVLLSGQVKRRLNDYWGRFKAGEMKKVGLES